MKYFHTTIIDFRTFRQFFRWHFQIVFRIQIVSLWVKFDWKVFPIIGSVDNKLSSEVMTTWSPSQYPKRRLSVRSRKVSEPRDLYLELSDRSEIWRALRQQCCRCACQISKRCDDLKYQSRGFETLRDLTERRLFRYWDGALVAVSICDKTSYCKISQSLEAVKFVFRIVRSHWNLTDTSATVLAMCLSNSKAIWWFKLPISQLRGLTRSRRQDVLQDIEKGPWYPQYHRVSYCTQQ